MTHQQHASPESIEKKTKPAASPGGTTLSSTVWDQILSDAKDGIMPFTVQQPLLVRPDNVTINYEDWGTAWVRARKGSDCYAETDAHVVHDYRGETITLKEGTATGVLYPGDLDVKIQLPGDRSVSAQVISVDSRRDQALIKFQSDNPDQECKVLETGKRPNINDTVLAIGFSAKSEAPQKYSDFSRDVSHGTFLEAKYSESLSLRNPDPDLQAGVPILGINSGSYKGNSGGPLLNGSGQVVGRLIAGSANASFYATPGKLDLP